MPVDHPVLDDYIRRRGPHLHHVTVRDALRSIREDGLVPGSQLSHRVHDGFFATRADHVYLCDLLSVAVVEVPGDRALLAVDLRVLDPERIDPDEDAVQQSFFSSEGAWLSPEAHPPIREVEGGREQPGQEHALARWAEETVGFDGPAITAKSLSRGRISYRGVIGPNAVEEIHLPSEAVGHFVTGATSVLGSGVLLPAAPLVGHADTEIDRACVLATSLIEGCIGAEDRGKDPVHFDRPEDAIPTRDRLLDQAREHRHADELDASLPPHAAAELADAVSDFQPDVGWSANCDQCAIVAERALECLRVVQEVNGQERAEQLARSAILAAIGA